MTTIHSDVPVILGIDPGTRVLGYAVLVAERKPRLLTMGTLSLEKIEDHPSRLYKIFERISQLAEGYKPTVLAIEAPFFGKNVKSMLMLGRAQGVAISAAVYKGLAVYEYSPRKIKQSVTGRGSASKEQVAALLSQIFMIDFSNEKLDATDALAVALCHSLQTVKGVIGKTAVSVKKTKKSSGKNSGWDKFIKDNPGKVL